MSKAFDPVRDALQHGPPSPTRKPSLFDLLNPDTSTPSPVEQPASLPQPVLPPPAPAPQPSVPPPKVAPLAYMPENRRTPATSMLYPATLEEISDWKRARHALRIRAGRPDPSLENVVFPESVTQADRVPQKRRASIKRKREPETEEDRLSKRSKDSGLVAEHYNTRRNVDVTERRNSPILGLKRFNNWIKSVLIAKFSKSALANAPHVIGTPNRGRVLDMGCGKGGDLQKWQKAKIADYVGLDIAAKSIADAQHRYQNMRNKPFPALFSALDCYTQSIMDGLPESALSEPFDVVSMQFCMHYAFDSVPKVRMMLENVSKYLRTGGVYLGTVPNADLLLTRIKDIPPGEPLTFGNSVYRVRFDGVAPAGPSPLFGHRYHFYLEDAVDDVPEYIVHWDNFQQLAKEHGLHQIYREEFHDIFTAEREHKEFGTLLERMGVVTSQGESEMDEDQWEAANVYIAFAFEKR